MISVGIAGCGGDTSPAAGTVEVHAVNAKYMAHGLQRVSETKSVSDGKEIFRELVGLDVDFSAGDPVFGEYKPQFVQLSKLIGEAESILAMDSPDFEQLKAKADAMAEIADDLPGYCNRTVQVYFGIE